MISATIAEALSTDAALSHIPEGMIWRLETLKRGRFFFIYGWPTPKGNFSAVRFPGHGDTPLEAIKNAVYRQLTI